MVKLLESAFLAGQKLDIVYQKDVRTAVFSLEIAQAIVSDGVNKLIGKRLGRYICNFTVRVESLGAMTDSLHEMGFTEAGAAVDKKRVVAGAYFFRGGLRGGVGEAIVTSDNKRVKGVSGVEVYRTETGHSESLLKKKIAAAYLP